jgi:predicted acyl esterase
MNEDYQPTYEEFLLRSNEGTEPIRSLVGGSSAPTVEIVTDPAAVDGVVRIPVGGRVRFDASSAQAHRNDRYGGERVVDWIWEFSDGSQANAPVVVHEFERAGVYRITLVVHDDTGWQTRANLSVEVGDLPCGEEPMEVWIPTGPGLLMHGYVTVPSGAGPFPTILEYGPYVPTIEDSCSSTIRNGYARARISAPGRGRSTGAWDMFGRQTQEGGYDAVEWFAAQPWSNGKVGLYGLSGPAVAALLTAGSNPPHLSCVSAVTSYGDFYRDMVNAGGVPNSNTFVNAWVHTITVQDSQMAYPQDTPAGTAPGPGPNGEVIDHGVTNVERAVDMAAHPYFDDWWRERSIVDYPSPKAPVLYYGNARDLWPRATFEIADWIAPAGGRVVQLQGGHGAGDLTGWLAPRENHLWYEWCLKGVDNGVQTRPGLITFTTYGGDAAAAFSFGRFEAFDGFLGPEVRPTRLFLRASGSNDERPQYHGLSADPPQQGEAPGVLLYSPAQGATSDTTEGTAPQVSGAQETWETQSLIYETPALEEELSINGPATLQVYARILAPDMAFTAHVNDVWPDGTSHYISKGALLASHRALDEDRSIYMQDEAGARVLIRPYHPHTEESVERLIPGQVYRFDIEIWGLHNAFLPGHRLRLVLAAQDLGWRTHAVPGAAATILNDPAHTSTLNLPVVPRGRGPSPFPFAHGGPTWTGAAPGPGTQDVEGTEVRRRKLRLID